MKPYLLSLCLLIFLSCSEKAETQQTDETDTAKVSMNVLDHYRALAHPIISQYPLSLHGDTFSTQSNAEYEIPATVDFANGYINIQDDGTGGGSTDLSVVLFRKEDGTALIGVATAMFDGIAVFSEVNFFQAEGEGYKDVTESVLPTVFYKDYLDESLEASVIEGISEVLQPQFILPQEGTTVQAQLSADPVMTMMKCESLMGADSDLCAELKTLIPNLTYSVIDLNWNKADGKFSVGEKR